MTAVMGGVLVAVLCDTARAQQPAAGAAADTGVNAITSAMIALGDSIFHGKAAGGACLICHGADAKGTPGLAPNLTDAKWLHGDGSYTAILSVVKEGVPDPKEGSMPMPPMGGSRFTPDQLRAVAAYIYSLSHPELRSHP